MGAVRCHGLYREERYMKVNARASTTMLRVAYWLGIVLDAVSFVQMAVPSLGRAMMGSSASVGPEYVFAIEMGAGLMLGWTALLFWADRKPTERRAVIPFTMIVIAWNHATLWYGVRSGLLPIDRALPQIILSAALFVYYGLCATISLIGNRADSARA